MSVYVGVIVKLYPELNKALVKLINESEVYAHIPEKFTSSTYSLFTLQEATKFIEPADNTPKSFNFYWQFSNGDKVLVLEKQSPYLNNYEIIGIASGYIDKNAEKFNQLIQKLKDKYHWESKKHFYLQIINNVCLIIEPLDNGKFNRLEILIPDAENEINNPKVSIKITSAGDIYINTTGKLYLHTESSAQPYLKGKSFVDVFCAHTHPTGVGPSGPPLSTYSSQAVAALSDKTYGE